MKCDANERSMSHHLANYIEPLFPGWDVDCEYNRDGLNDPKRLGLDESERTVVGDANACTVFPDIIVHHRGQSGADHNLVVIEVKKSSNKSDRSHDEWKLRAYREQLGYQNAFFVALRTDSSMESAWTLTSL